MLGPLWGGIAGAIGSMIADLFLGYFVYEAYILKYGMAAVGSIYGNVIQGIAGIIFAVVISEFIKKKIDF